MHNYCIVGAFTNRISHTQTARPGTTTCRSYKNLFRAGIEPVTRSAAVDRSATAPTVPFNYVLYSALVKHSQFTHTASLTFTFFTIVKRNDIYCSLHTVRRYLCRILFQKGGRRKKNFKMQFNSTFRLKVIQTAMKFNLVSEFTQSYFNPEPLRQYLIYHQNLKRDSYHVLLWHL